MIGALRNIYSRHPRLLTAIELVVVISLCAVSFWGFAFFGNPFYALFLMGFIVAIVVIISLVVRKDSLKDLGLRFDNLWLSLREAGLVFVLFLGVVAIIAYARRFPVGHTDLKHVITFLTRGFLQELVCLSYFYIRFYTLYSRKLPTIFSTAAIFACLHFPNLPFVALTFGLGALFAYLFTRHRNVFVIGLLHGLTVIVVVVLLRPGGLFTELKVGPRTLKDVSVVLNTQWREGEPIRLGSHELIPRAVGETWEERITEICPGYSARTDLQRTELLEDYFSSGNRVFCLITRKDYDRLLTPDFRIGLSVLAKGYILRRRFTLEGIINSVVTDGDLGGYVVQEVYLVSNYPFPPAP